MKSRISHSITAGFKILVLSSLCTLAWTNPGRAESSNNRILFEKNERSPIVKIALVLKSGGVNDPRGREGLSNFVGEMLLRGTRNQSKAQFERKLDELGAEIAVEVRAEALIIRGSVLNTKIKPFLALLDDAIAQQEFSSREMDKLRSELLSGMNDIKGRDGRLAQEVFPEYLFPNHPYGNFLMGTTQSLRSINKTDIQKHYSRLFHRDAFTLIGSGNLATDELAGWFSALNAKLPQASKQEDSWSAPLPASQRQVIFIDKPERTQTQVLIGQVGTLIQGPSFFPLHIGNFAFGGGSFSSRLMQEIRVKRGWSYGAGSNFRFGTQKRSWSLSFMPKAQDTAPALAHVLSMLTELKKSGITETEFEQAQASLSNGAAFTGNTPEKRVENRVLEVTLGLPIGYMDTWKNGIESTSRKQVNQELAQFISPDRLTILILGTQSPEFLELIARTVEVPRESIRVIPYTEAL